MLQINIGKYEISKWNIISYLSVLLESNYRKKKISGKVTDSEGVHNFITQELWKNSKHMLVYRQLPKSY